MGNHGGATAEGQPGILEGLGITEATVGAPIRPRMDTRLVGHTPAGTPVYVSEEAIAADGVILVNRIKPHTDFESTRLGSGILKMAAIGLGRSEGAAACHRAAGRLGFEAVLPAVAKVDLAHVKMVAPSASSRTACTSSPASRRSRRRPSPIAKRRSSPRRAR